MELRSTLMPALTTILISLSFLKEGEGLSNSWRSKRTRTAFNFRNTIRILANKLAFRLGTVRLMALPIAFRFFTDRLTFRLWRLAMSNTMRLFTNSYAFRAIKHFAAFIWAFYFTFWFFAFYITNCVFRLGA